MFKQGKVVEPEKYDENVDIETESDSINDDDIEEEDDIEEVETCLNDTAQWIRVLSNTHRFITASKRLNMKILSLELLKIGCEQPHQFIIGAPFAFPDSLPRKD